MRGTIVDLPTPHPMGPAMPALYQDDPFAQSFLSALDTVLAPVVGTLDNLDAYLDPYLTPDDFLVWLGELGRGRDRRLVDERAAARGRRPGRRAVPPARHGHGPLGAARDPHRRDGGDHRERRHRVVDRPGWRAARQPEAAGRRPDPRRRSQECRRVADRGAGRRGEAGPRQHRVEIVKLGAKKGATKTDAAAEAATEEAPAEGDADTPSA